MKAGESPARTSTAARRLGRALGRSVVIGATFLLWLVVGIVLHLGLPAPRLAVRDAIVNALNGTFEGTFSIGRIESIGFFGVEAIDLDVSDPMGRSVLRVGELDLDLHLLEIAMRGLAPYEKWSIVLDRVVAREVSVHLLPTDRLDDKGRPMSHPSIKDAFALREPSLETDEPGRPIRLWMNAIELENAFVRESLPGLPVLEARAPLTRARLLVTDAGIALDVSRFDVRATGALGADVRAEGALKLRAPGAISGDVHGFIGGVPFEETFRIERGRWTLSGRSENVPAPDARAIAPAWPFDQPVSIEHSLDGYYPRFLAKVTLRADAGTIVGSGRVALLPELEADLDVDAEALNPSKLRRELPDAIVTLRSTTEFWLREGRPRAAFNATLFPSTFGATDLPAVDLRGTLDDTGLAATGIAHERGLPLHLNLRRPPGRPLEFEVALGNTSLVESPRLWKLLGAQGLVRGKWSGTVEDDKVASRLEFGGERLAVEELRIARWSAAGPVTIPFSDPTNPTLDLVVTAEDVARKGLAFPRMKTSLSGSLAEPHIALEAETKRGEKLEGSANANVARRGLYDAKLVVSGKGKPIAISFSEFEVEGGRLRLVDFELESEGRITTYLDLGARDGHVRFVAENVNFGRVVDFAGEDASRFDGRLDANVDLLLGTRSRGRVDLKLREANLDGHPIDAEFSLRADEKRLRGSFSGTLRGSGTVRGAYDAELSGHPFDLPSYERATYSLAGNVEKLDVASLGRRFAEGVPWSVDGTIDGTWKVEKREPELLPDVDIDLVSSQLAFYASKEFDDFAIRGADLGLVCQSRTERDSVSCAVRAFPTDARFRTASGGGAEYLTAAATVSLPLRRASERLPTPEELRAWIREAPVNASLSLPRRSLASLDEVVRLPTLSGSIEGRGAVRGTVGAPVLFLYLDGSELVPPAPYDSSPVSGTVRVEGDLVRRHVEGELALSTTARGGRDPLGRARFDVTLAEDAFALAPPADTARWTGELTVDFDGAPLTLVPEVRSAGLDGELQGSVSVLRREYAPEIHGELRLREISVRGRSMGSGEIGFDTGPSGARAVARLKDNYGELELRAEARVNPTPWAVELDEASPLYAALEIQEYGLAAFHPFFTRTFSELSGTLSGSLRAELEPAKDGEARDARWEGRLRLHDGRATLRSMGLPITDLRLDAVLGRKGDYNVVSVDEVVGRARSNVDNMRGALELFFEGVDLHHGTFELSQEAVPVLREGVKLAELTGHASGEIRRSGDEIEIDLVVPELAADLPAQTSQTLIELEENPTISLLEPLRASEDEAKEQGTPIAIRVKLGERVRVSNPLMNVRLSGSPELRYDEELSMRGKIALEPGSRVQVLSRAFVIQQGSVLLDEHDLTNPFLDITAVWRAPSGVLIYAKLTGPASEPELSWSSDPPTPGGETAIMALVLGGSSGGGQSTDAGAAGLTYGAAALNQILGQSGVRSLEFYASRQSASQNRKVAQFTSSAWDNYTAAFRISDELWFEGSYQRESAGPKARSGFSGSLDWRFSPDWSARTDIGQLGVGADILWQYRY